MEDSEFSFDVEVFSNPMCSNLPGWGHNFCFCIRPCLHF